MTNAWLTAFTLVIPPPEVDIFPKVDTFRGGRALVIHGVPKIFDSSLDVTFRQQLVPAGWTPVLALGARARGSPEGLLVTTGPTAGSFVQLESQPLYTAFEGTLTVLPLSPDKAASSPVDHTVFEYVIDGINYAQVRARRVGTVDAERILVDTVIGLQDETLVGGGLVLTPGQELDLSITRMENYLFLHVNGQLLAQTTRFTDEGTGVFRVTVGNNAAATRVATLISDLTVRSHGMINGRLIKDKVDFAERRIVGLVPAATLAEVGLRDIVLFGPWGATTLSAAFEYVLPEGRTIGGAIDAPLTSYVDPALRD